MKLFRRSLCAIEFFSAVICGMRWHGTSAIRNVLDRLTVLSKISPPCFYHRDAIGKERTDVTKNLKQVPFWNLGSTIFLFACWNSRVAAKFQKKRKMAPSSKKTFFSILFSSYICLFFIIIVVVLGRCVCWMRAFVYIILRWHPLPSSSNYGQKRQRKRRNTQKWK